MTFIPVFTAMSVHQPQLRRPHLQISIPRHPRPADTTITASSSTSPVSIGSLSLQVVKQIWSSYPEFNISSRTWQSRPRRPSSNHPTPVFTNALGLDLGLTTAQGAYQTTLIPMSSIIVPSMDRLQRESSLESGELPENSTFSPATRPSSSASSPSPSPSPPPLPPPPPPDSATNIARARSALLESFHHHASSPERKQFVDQLEAKLTDDIVCDIIRNGPMVLDDLRKAGHGEQLENVKRKFAIMSGPEGDAEDHARRTRRRVDEANHDVHVSPPPVHTSPPFSPNADQDIEMIAAEHPSSNKPSAPSTALQSEQEGSKTAAHSDPYVPRIYVAKIGQSAPGLAEVTFELDERVAEAAAGWGRRTSHFRATVPHVQLHFVGVNLHDAEAIVQTGNTQTLPLLASKLPLAWPLEGTLYVSLNQTKGLWDPSHFTATSPGIDISAAVQPGLNTLKIVALNDLSSTVFMVIMLAAQEREQRPWTYLDRVRELSNNSPQTGSPRIVDFVPS